MQYHAVMLGIPEGLPDRYRELRPLGSGGMGEVWLARDLETGRELAIKFLSEAQGKDERYLRFRREVEALSTLQDPAIVRILDAGKAGERPYFTMDYVKGKTLARRIEEGIPPLFEGLEIAAELARALSVVHDAGFCHRDLKPANVVLDARGRPRLIDFGLVGFSEELAHTALTRTGAVLGSLAYMPPEILRGEKGDARSDVFQLGVLLHLLFTGQNPMEGIPWPDRARGGHETAVRAIEAADERDGGRLSELLRSALATERTERPTARDLAEALAAWPADGGAVGIDDTEEMPSGCHVGLSSSSGRLSSSSSELSAARSTRASFGSSQVSSPPRRGCWAFGVLCLLFGGALGGLVFWGRSTTSAPGDSEVPSFRWRRPQILGLDRMAIRFEGTVPEAVQVRFLLPEGGGPAPQAERRVTFGTVQKESLKVRRWEVELVPPLNGAVRVELRAEGRRDGAPARFLLDPGSLLEEALRPIDRFIDRIAQLDLFSLCGSIQGSQAIRIVSGSHLVDPQKRLVNFLHDQGVSDASVEAFVARLDWYLEGRGMAGSLRARRLLPLRRLAAVTSDRSGRELPWGPLESRFGFRFFALPLREDASQGLDIRPITDWHWSDYRTWVQEGVGVDGWRSIADIDCIERRTAEGDELPLWTWIAPELSRREWSDEGHARVMTRYMKAAAADYRERRPSVEQIRSRWSHSFDLKRPQGFEDGELRLDLYLRTRPFLELLVSVDGADPIHVFAVAADHVKMDGFRPYDPHVLSIPLWTGALRGNALSLSLSVLRLPAAEVSETLGLGAVGLRWRSR